MNGIDTRRTPAKDGFSMPPEWGPHARCFISWPCREPTYRGKISQAKLAYKAVIEAISGFEPVTVLSDPSTFDEAREALDPDIDVLRVELDDSWIRDNGPIFVRSADGKVAMVNFRFNAWGSKSTYSKDDRVPLFLSDHLRVRRYDVPMVLEGGAISVDGTGTLLTTEQCLLSPNRNPEMSREEIERHLSEYLGVRKVVWLAEGVVGDITDGHVDGVACFAKDGLVVASYTEDESDPNFDCLRKNLEILETATDARGRSVEVLKIVQPRPIILEGLPLTPGYANHYLANGGVVVPLYGIPEDALALETLRQGHADREVVGVDARYIEIAGGAVHCVTQQQPYGALQPP